MIIAQTATQPANGTSEEDITAELVGSWATAMGKQSEENARQACLANGGDERLCSHVVIGKETHEVIQKNGHKFALIHTTVYTNGTITDRTLRILAIRSEALVSVACVRTGDFSLAPTMTPCAEEILKSLNVDFRL